MKRANESGIGVTLVPELGIDSSHNKKEIQHEVTTSYRKLSREYALTIILVILTLLHGLTYF